MFSQKLLSESQLFCIPSNLLFLPLFRDLVMLQKIQCLQESLEPHSNDLSFMEISHSYGKQLYTLHWEKGGWDVEHASVVRRGWRCEIWVPARLLKESRMYRREMSRRVEKANDRLSVWKLGRTLPSYLQCLVQRNVTFRLNLTSMLKTEHGFSSWILSQLVCHWSLPFCRTKNTFLCSCPCCSE